jgi:hypothetical protein
VADKGFAFDHHGVAGVVSALKTGNDRGVFGQDVYNLALALVAPLGTDDNDVCHDDELLIEEPCSKLQGIFDRKECCRFIIRSLTPQQATGNALAMAVQWLGKKSSLSVVPSPLCRADAFAKLICRAEASGKADRRCAASESEPEREAFWFAITSMTFSEGIPSNEMTGLQNSP